MYKFSNNAIAEIITDLNIGDTELYLDTGKGDLFATLGVDETQIVTLTNADNSAYEIVEVTNNFGDTLTVTRALEGTEERNWDAGSIVFASLTKGVLEAFSTGGGTPVIPPVTPPATPAIDYNPDIVNREMVVLNTATPAESKVIMGMGSETIIRLPKTNVGSKIDSNSESTDFVEGTTYGLGDIITNTPDMVTLNGYANVQWRLLSDSTDPDTETTSVDCYVEPNLNNGYISVVNDINGDPTPFYWVANDLGSNGTVAINTDRIEIFGADGFFRSYWERSKFLVTEIYLIVNRVSNLSSVTPVDVTLSFGDNNSSTLYVNNQVFSLSTNKVIRIPVTESILVEPKYLTMTIDVPSALGRVIVSPYFKGFFIANDQFQSP